MVVSYRHIIGVLLIVSCCVGTWLAMSQKNVEPTIKPTSNELQFDALATEEWPTDVELNEAASASHTSLACSDKALPLWLDDVFTQSTQTVASNDAINCFLKYLRDADTNAVNQQLLTSEHFFRWLSFVFIYQAKLPAELHFASLLERQNLYSFLSIIQSLEFQNSIHNFLAAHGSSIRELNSALLGYLLATSPYELLDILNAGLSEDVNVPAVALLFSATQTFSLAEIWPLVIAVELDEERDELIQMLVQRYLTQDEEATMYYLSDFYTFSNNGNYGQQFQFSNAINSMMAWHLNQLDLLAPAHYDKESPLVTRKIYQLLTDDPSRVFEQLKHVTSPQLQQQVFASVVQSSAFFSLEKSVVLNILKKQPPELAHLLARAYVLQFAYLSPDEYQEQITGLESFLQHSYPRKPQ